MGAVNELRSRSSKAQEGLGGESALERHRAQLHGGGRRPPARLDAHRAHARAARRREAVEARQRRALRQHAGRADRQPGDAAGEGRPEGDLPVGLAGRRRREHRRRDVSGPVALSGQLGAAGRAADQQHVHARRPDPAHGRQGATIDYLRADRRRRRSRIRRRAERVRADEGDDRGGRRGRALRGPARVGQEVRPHGRQGARADARGGREARSRRGSPPTCMGVPTILLARTDAEAADLRDLRRRRQRQAVPAPASARSKASTGRATASSRRSRAVSPTRRTPT